ncbi:MAG: fused MFS/spermidine synthase [Lentisphaeria bacterium]|nr:fused MFS/spermidine synthase [Lentisphaeria bacterium]
MLFLSGFAGLIYQVLWMRQLGLLFGNTAHAAAMTLAVFFAGLAAGNWFWGRRVSASRNPLRLYAWLEGGIAVTALLYFGVIALFYLIYPDIYRHTSSGLVLGLVKCLLACGLIFPPAFFMGGTIPAMGQYLIVKRELFGTVTARIYGVNTIGAALGALSAAFVAVPLFGFNTTCVIAMGITCCVAGVAYRISRGWRDEDRRAQDECPRADALSAVKKAASKRRGKENQKGKGRASAADVQRPAIFSLAFMSGFSLLALEVLWTRMFAQIHENSVYSFATVLVIVLVCLSLGALLASLLAATKLSPRLCLSTLLLASGGALAFSPRLFISLTDNLTMLPVSGTFGQYVRHLFTLGFATVAPACVLLGSVFPFLMKHEQVFAFRIGKSIGHLSAVNTVGAIVGSVACGFFLLRIVGMWWTMWIIAVLYVSAGLLLTAKLQTGRWRLRIVGGVVSLLLFTVLNPSNLRVVGADPMRGEQTVLEVWETSDCTVSAVKDSSGHNMLKINSNYVLGSTGAVLNQVFQARIPLFIYPKTESLFFLGMGTGITAGGALDTGLFDSVKSVVVCEMVPEVVEAAERYIAGGTGGEDYTHGLFNDPRVDILVEDGRHYLLGTDSAFDMINADLFLPYRHGAGSLYSRDHFVNAKKRLTPDGVFVQWLPLFQLTDFEFGVISRTMLSVFDQVTLWRNNFQPGAEIVALVGHNGNHPLPPCDLPSGEAKRAAIQGKTWRDLPRLSLMCDEQTVALFYCGNMTASKDLFDTYPVNTDDKPVIEYRSPISLRQKTGTRFPPTFVGPKLADFIDRLQENCPPDRDPMLINRTPENRRLPVAGAALHRAWIAFAMQDAEACRKAWRIFTTEWANR